MSDQRISGNSSGPWHNYSQPTPTQSSNAPAPSSSQHASSSWFVGLIPARQAVQHPATLEPGMVSGTSAAWLNEYRNSSDPGQSALAKAVISAIRDGSLNLGRPESQTAVRAQYGKQLQTTHGTVSILVEFRPRGDGRFDVIGAAMRDSSNPTRKAIIAAPLNASSSGRTQPIPAPLPPSAPPPAPIRKSLPSILNRRWPVRLRHHYNPRPPRQLFPLRSAARSDRSSTD